MINIESNDIRTKINGESFPKNSYTVKQFSNYVRIKLVGSGEIINFRMDEVTIEGSEPSDLETLFNYLDQNSFKNGGGNGDGVVGVKSVSGDGVGGTSDYVTISFPTPTEIGAVSTEDLDKKSPELGLNEFLVNRGSGNVSGKILPSDTLTNFIDGGVVRYSTNNNLYTTSTSQNNINSTFVIRTDSGQIAASPAINSNETIILSQFNSELELKVDKIEGYGLTPEPFTSAEKDKLANVEDPKFQGQFPSEADLQANGEGGAGNYAYVDGGVGEPVHLYAWNSTTNTWDLVAGESTAETPTSVLQKYESNPDRNPFTDTRRDKLDSITAIFTSTLKTAYDQAVSWITTNGQIFLDHITNVNNPHNVTAEQIGLGDIDEQLENKADLVNGKIPQEQLPETTGGSDLISQVIATSTTQYIIADLPENAPDLLRFELFIPNTIAPSFISMRFNGINNGIYKHVLQNVNNATYSIVRNYSQNQLRVLSSQSGAVVGRYNIRVEGTISNVAGQVKIANGTAYLAGVAPADAPDINNFFGSAHDQNITNGKITQLLFVAMNTNGTGRIAAGSVLKIYGIK